MDLNSTITPGIQRARSVLNDLRDRLDRMARRSGNSDTETSENGTSRRETTFLRRTINLVEDTVDEIEEPLENVWHRMTSNGGRKTLEPLRSELRKRARTVNRNLGNQLLLLASRVRKIGQRLDRQQQAEQIADRIENTALQVRQTFRPSAWDRVNEFLKDHPLVSLGTALSAGYLVYRILRR